jgi:hypothetical protein
MSKIVQQLAAPITSTPERPPGLNQDALNHLWGYVGFGIAIMACFGLAGCAVLAWSNHRDGDSSNPGVKKAGWVLGGALAFGIIAGVVGTVTGT